MTVAPRGHLRVSLSIADSQREGKLVNMEITDSRTDSTHHLSQRGPTPDSLQLQAGSLPGSPCLTAVARLLPLSFLQAS
jgi:hypothetical protein